MKVSPARAAAFDALLLIQKDLAFSSVVLPHLTNELAPKDRSLAHEIVLGVLRRQFYLDRVVDTFAANKKLDIEVRLALRIGIFQLLFLDRVPDYSVLNESVNLVQRAKKSSAKGFVNAVLRRVTRDQIKFEFVDELERISIETSHPSWLIEKWAKDLGVERAETLAAANNIPPAIAFRLTNRGLNKGLGKSASWQKSEIVEGCFFADRMDAELLILAESGDVYFQDEASQLVASAVVLESGARFLDVCAAPGGKTTLISSLWGAEAGLIVAGDLPWPRVELLRSNCRKQETEVSVVQYDADWALPFAEASFDAVFVDAPCSGTGTIRHNPEIRYTVKPSDFAEMANKQLRILTNASKLVIPGGRVYYSTCSLEPEENEVVIASFLEKETDFTIVATGVNTRFATPDGFLRTLPDRDAMDGFFLTVLEL